MKYLFLNDIEYLIHHRKKILSCIFIVPILFLMIYIQSKLTGLEIFHLSMGTNLDVQSHALTELISFVFNITIFLFFIIDIYVKDIEYQLDQIFLRMKPIKWYLQKSINFMITIILIKIIQYVFVSLLIIRNISLSDIIILLRNDCIYIIFLQFLFLLIYMISILFFKSKLFSIFLFLLIFIIVPKNIYELENIGIYVLIIVLIHVVNGYFFKKWNKKIIENV